jgi:hypothetical protein
MPLIGLIDPSHYERMHSRDGRLPNWLTVEELMVQLQEPNPKFAPWTWELATAVIEEHQERGDRISTSLLTTACPRAEVIMRKENYIGSLDDEYASLRGTMVHRTLEAYSRELAVAEVRFYTTVDGIRFSGSPDLLTEHTVYDYKTTENPPGFGYAYRHHTEQVELNAFIVRHAEAWELENGDPTDLPWDPREIELEHAVVVYLGPKSPKIIEVQKKQEFKTPAGVTKEGKRPYIWSDEEVLEVFRPRLHVMRAALESYPEWPDPVKVKVDGKMKTFTAEEVWGGRKGFKCPGPPLCNLKTCVGRREPDMYTWPKRCVKCKGSGKRGRGACSRCQGSGVEEL